MMDLDFELDFLANRTNSMSAKREHDNPYLGSRSFTSYRDRLLQDKYALAADLKYSSSATPTTTTTAGAGGSSGISSHHYLAGSSSALISGAGGSNPLLNKTASQYTSSIANSANIDKLISSSTGFYSKGAAYTGGVGSSSFLTGGGGGSLSHLPSSVLSATAPATTSSTAIATATSTAAATTAATTTTWASTTTASRATAATTTAQNIGHSTNSNNYGTTTAAAAAAPNSSSTTVNKQPSLYSNGQLNHSSMAAGDQSRAAGGHQMGALQQLFDDLRQIEDTVDSIEIPARGRCRVYMAKYGYDPFKQSPNDNPDAELAFNAGDHIMVFDDIDEDGYFIGELMDGRRGYVPSNWLNQLTGEDLFEFQATTLYKQAHALSGGGGGGAGNASAGILAGKIGTAGYTGGLAGIGAASATAATGMAGLGMGAADDDSECNSYPPEFYDAIVSDTLNHSNFQHLLAPEDYHRMNGYVDLDDVNEVDDECLSDYERAEAEQMRRAVPPPQRLILERQLNKSILIGWLHPQAAKGTIVSYQVYVDGVLKSTVPSGDRTKALLEGVDSNIPHRISVRAIDLNGRHSNDAGCTIVIGQRIPFAPSCVKASHITSDSALISWLPCNSNFHHVVAVNSVEVQTVRPGVYKHLINGLSANTLYRVWVRAKPGKIFSIDEKNPKKLESLTTYVDFKTMPKSLPDPPVNVQVEAGPQRRTLLVTWLPLTLNDYGSSNGCAVTGYAVFAGHKKLADIDSPTGDHALLDLADLESLHKKSVTVRTKSGENLSQDSMPCQIPDEYLKAGNVRPSERDQHHHHHHHHQQQLQQQQQHHHSVGQATTARHQHHHQQRVSDPMQISSTSGHQSPMRQHAGAGRYGGQQSAAKMLQQQQQQHRGLVGPSKYSMARGRHLARSLQNLESDLDSRRSSIPAIEVTRETSGSEMINQTESYSEEEFENSMRFRASAMRGSGSNSANKPGSRMAANRYRARQSHSVDGAHRQFDAAGGHSMQAYAQQAAAGRSNNINNSAIFNSTATANNQRDNIIRYFVALFDYDPSTMSPNPNAASEELAFKAGSIIKIYGDKGADEFYRGELDNRMGFVPSNVVEEIKDPNRLFNLQQQDKYSANMMMNNMRSQQQQPTGQMGGVVGNNLQQQNSRTIDAANQQGVKRMKAMYDYDPQENSPNADTESEIPFKFGDIIYVYGKMDTDGFYMGEVERTKQRGLVPSNFLAEEPLPGQQQQQQQPFASGNQMMGQAGMMMDNFQQQPQRPNQQFVGNLAVQQQQQQQQQQMQRPGGIQGVLPPQSQNLNRADGIMQPQNNALQQQQNINRPNSLSLGLQQQQQVGNLNQQQQQQLAAMNDPRPMMAQANMMMNQAGAANQMAMPGQQQPMQFAAANQLQQQQPQQNVQQMQAGNQSIMMNNQQQQQPGGGVLSNLLSSGKQIIGAATTPRMPNQPAQFSSMPGQLQQQQQQQPQLIDGGLNFGGQAPGQMGTMQGLNQVRQPLVGGAGMQSMAPGALNQPAQMGTGADQQRQPLAMGNQLNNSFSLMPNNSQPQQLHTGGYQQQPHQQPGMGFSAQRGPMSQPGLAGEEQGGNILNTFKNMLKL